MNRCRKIKYFNTILYDAVLSSLSVKWHLAVGEGFSLFSFTRNFPDDRHQTLQ